MKYSFKKALTVLALSAAALFSTTSAQAQQIIYIEQTFTFDLSNLNVTKNFALETYSGSGELVGVSYQLTGYIQGTIFASNSSPDAVSIVNELQETVTFKVTGLPGGAPLELSAFPTAPASFVLGVIGSGTEYYSLAGNASADSGVVNINSTYFDSYDQKLGASANLPIVFTAKEQIVFDKSGGSASGGSNAQAQGTIKVTYAVAVPEPGTWAVMALGAGLLIASTKFRRKA